MYYAENLLDRFRHVDALATRGVGGERDNALRILREMEAKYPGIRSQAYPRTPNQDAPNLDAFTAASGNFGGATRPPPAASPPPGWDWRSAAQDALGWAARMAAEMAAGKEVDAAVDRLVEVQSKNLSSGKFQLSVRFPAEEMAYHLSRMNDIQRATLVDKVTALFREELIYAITPVDEDE
jgi:hypothetical protein